MLYSRTNRRLQRSGFLFTAILAGLPAIMAGVSPATAASARPASHIRLAQSSTTPPPPPNFGAQVQPADLNGDLTISPLELSTYALDFLKGTVPAQGPNPVPPLYLSDAALIFLTASGVYHYDPNAPSGQLPYVPGPASSAARAVIGSNVRLASTRSRAPLGTAIAACPAKYAPGAAFTMALNLTPGRAAHAYAVEDTVPAGWKVLGVSDGGVYDASSHTVRWFFLDHTARTLHYRVVPSGSISTAMFHGEAAFDNGVRSIAGVRSLALESGSWYGAKA